MSKSLPPACLTGRSASGGPLSLAEVCVAASHVLKERVGPSASASAAREERGKGRWLSDRSEGVSFPSGGRVGLRKARLLLGNERTTGICLPFAFLGKWEVVGHYVQSRVCRAGEEDECWIMNTYTPSSLTRGKRGFGSEARCRNRGRKKTIPLSNPRK